MNKLDAIFSKIGVVTMLCCCIAMLVCCTVLVCRFTIREFLK